MIVLVEREYTGPPHRAQWFLRRRINTPQGFGTVQEVLHKPDESKVILSVWVEPKKTKATKGTDAKQYE